MSRSALPDAAPARPEPGPRDPAPPSGGAARRTAAALRRLLDRPAVALLVLVLAGAGARAALAVGNVTPWIFADEFIYSELARSLADRGDLLVRDAPIYYSTLVPMVHAPGYLLGGTAEAYGWIKAANALVMAAAALPGYGLARLALSRRLSLAFAALLLAWPAYAYVGVVMTEPLTFTAYVTAAWALARALVRPTLPRQALVLVCLAVALLVKLQAVTLVASVPLACVLVAALGAGGGRAAVRRLRSFTPLLVATVGLPLLAVAAQAARGRSPRSLLGGYAEAEAGVGLGAFTDWAIWHVAVTALAVGVVPLALALAAWGRVAARRTADSETGAVAVTVLATALPLLVLVTVFAVNHAGRVEERNLFVVEPLVVLVALIGLAVTGVSRLGAVAMAALLALAIADLPVQALLTPQPPLSDTLTLLAVLRGAATAGMSPASLCVLLAMAGVALTAAAVLARRGAAAWGLCAGLMALLVVMNAQITPLLADHSRAVRDATLPRPADWIDRAAGGERVAFLLSSADDPKLAWGAEFWNASLGTVLAVPGPMPAELGASRADLDAATGAFVPPPGHRLPTERLAVAPDAWRLAGTPVAHGRTAFSGMTLWRLDGPLRLRMVTAGLYGDGWTGPVLRVVRYGCRGGSFVVPLRPGYGERRAVRVVSGDAVRTATVGPGRTVVRAPARPGAGGACQLELRPLRTATGVELGNPADPRTLGVLAEPPGFRPRAEGRP